MEPGKILTQKTMYYLRAKRVFTVNEQYMSAKYDINSAQFRTNRYLFVIFIY